MMTFRTGLLEVAAAIDQPGDRRRLHQSVLGDARDIALLDHNSRRPRAPRGTDCRLGARQVPLNYNPDISSGDFESRRRYHHQAR